MYWFFPTDSYFFILAKSLTQEANWFHISSFPSRKRKSSQQLSFPKRERKKVLFYFAKLFCTYVFCSSADYILRFIYHFIYYNLRKLLKSNPSFGNFLRFFSIPELFICFFGCDSNMKSSSSIEKVKM
jgi:hypothetical protein